MTRNELERMERKNAITMVRVYTNRIEQLEEERKKIKRSNRLIKAMRKHELEEIEKKIIHFRVQRKKYREVLY